MFFVAEAYDDDEFANGGNGITGSHINNLYSAGFDAVYDAGLYWQIRNIYLRGWWASGISDLLNSHTTYYGRGARYLVGYQSNHDEVQPASKQYAGGAQPNMLWGKVPTAVAALVSGSFLFYNGHEIGEPVAQADDEAGDDGKVSLINYTYMPEFLKWRQGQSDNRTLALRRYYQRLVRLHRDQAAFNRPEAAFHDLLGPNAAAYGDAYRQWLFSFVRASGTSRFLVVANFDRVNAKSLTLKFTAQALQALGINNDGTTYTFTDRLNTEDDDGNPITPATFQASGSALWSSGLPITVGANQVLVLERNP